MRRIRRFGWRRRHGPEHVFGEILGGIAEAITEEAIREGRKTPRPQRVSTYNMGDHVIVEFIWANGAVISRRLTDDEINEMADTLDRFFEENKKDEKGDG